MIEFKITAATAEEFVDELRRVTIRLGLAIPSTAEVIPSAEVTALAQAAQDQVIKETARKQRAGKADAKPATEDAPKADDTPAPAHNAQPEPQPEKPSETPAPTTDSDAAVLDFDKDVAPLVLGYVKSHGKPWVMAVLSEFGVARASELAPERFGELVAALNDKDAA